MHGPCVPEADSEVMNADVDVLNLQIIKNAHENTCSPARQGAWGLGGIGRPNSV